MREVRQPETLGARRARSAPARNPGAPLPAGTYTPVPARQALQGCWLHMNRRFAAWVPPSSSVITCWACGICRRTLACARRQR